MNSKGFEQLLCLFCSKWVLQYCSNAVLVLNDDIAISNICVPGLEKSRLTCPVASNFLYLSHDFQLDDLTLATSNIKCTEDETWVWNSDPALNDG